MQILFYVVLIILEISLIMLFLNGKIISKVLSTPIIIIITAFIGINFLDEYQSRKQKYDEHTNFEENINKFIQSSKPEEFLNNIIPFKWDSVCIISPYSFSSYPISQADLNTFKYIGYEGLKIAYSGNEVPSLLFRTNKGNIKKLTNILLGNNINFKHIKNNNCYEYKDAIITKEAKH